LDKNNKKPWKIFFDLKLKKYGGSLIFDCETNQQLVSKIADNNIFLYNVLTAWLNFKRSYTIKQFSTAKAILWNNTSITKTGKTFFFESWYEKGITFSEHIFDYRKNNFYTFNDLISLYDI